MLKKAKRAYRKKFPRNYRLIPDIIHGINDEIYIIIALGCILLAILSIESDLYNNLKQKNLLVSEKQKASKELGFWQNQVGEHPDYRDAYFKLALINYQLQNIEAAKKYLDKALLLDPNFEEGKELRQALN